jgi:hypothetical protein
MPFFPSLSGKSGGRTKGTVVSGPRSPVTITEITLKPRASIDQEIPSSYNGFVFPLSGSIQAGADATSLKTGQTGWLDRSKVDGPSLLRVTAGEEGARLVLYAGQPQGDAIVSHGPFIGDSKQDIVRLYTEFQTGEFVSLGELVRAGRVGFDFLTSESPDLPDIKNADNYLRESALANDPPSKTVYDPERDGIRCRSLGVYEHWNNETDKKYSRNLGNSQGIELFQV